MQTAHPTFQSSNIGKVNQIRYLGDEPDFIFIKVLIAILYSLAFVSLIFFIWLGQTVVILQDFFSQLMGAEPANIVNIRVLGLVLGLPPALFSSVFLCACGQLLYLLMCVEKNTRQEKELMFYLLTEGRAGPPR